jgi:hypothetical protein
MGTIKKMGIFERLTRVERTCQPGAMVEKPEDYFYSSAREYAGIRGLLEVIFLE